MVERLTNVATAELEVYQNGGQFTDSPTTLGGIDRSYTFGTGLVPPASPSTVNLAVAPGAQWACLTTVSATGAVYTFLVGAEGQVFQGTRAFPTCAGSDATGLRPIS